MVIVTNVTYPPESAEAIAKRFLEAPQVPDYLTRKGPYVDATLENGITVFSIWEMDGSKQQEAGEFIRNYMAIFFGVPGFRYEIKQMLEVHEALKMIGMG
jgi:hypothetical protein